MNPLELDPQNPRRDFLKKLSAAGLAALMAPEPRLLGADAAGAPLVAPTPEPQPAPPSEDPHTGEF